MKSYIQTLYKVGFGPNVWGILSEESLSKYSNIVGYEYYGERELFYVEQDTIPSTMLPQWEDSSSS